MKNVHVRLKNSGKTNEERWNEELNEKERSQGKTKMEVYKAGKNIGFPVCMCAASVSGLTLIK